ncbi:MAG TPA: lactonase family protein [Planctomycetaceae bacterium]|nr:lactonase family protein [Planctomycetaceae bacterium]
MSNSNSQAGDGRSAAALLETTAANLSSSPKSLRVYIGTYTRGDSRGIYAFDLDLESGALESRGLAAELRNPSFLAIHPNRKFLYAVSEVSDAGGRPTGGVSAFAIEAGTGKLTALNAQPSGGAGPCHLVVDPSGQCVLVANYGGGSVAAIPVQANGRLAEPASTIQHEGQSVNPRRQQAPHAHSINVDKTNRFAVAADLGLDKLLVYRLKPDTGGLTPNDPPHATVEPGAGPRHFAFHPGGRFAYVINELDLTVTAFAWDAGRGALEAIQTVTTLPGDFQGSREGLSTAEVQVHPSGRFLYGSNRGHDTIAMFAIDGQTGKLTPLGHEKTGGRTPRNFGIDPTGAYLLAANQDSHSVVVFKINSQTGRLEPTEHHVEVPSPVCVKFLRLE